MFGQIKFGKTTKEELDELATELSKTTGRKFYIDYAYGRPKLLESLPRGGVDDTSPRLPRGRLADWIQAYLDGYNACKYKQRGN